MKSLCLPPLAVRTALLLAAVLPICAGAASVLPAGELAARRYGASTAVMADGRVMIAGGVSTPTTTASIEIYDPSNGRFESGPFLAMTEPRSEAVCVTLPNGRVLIAGGREDVGSSSSLRSVELFDPVTRQSSTTGMLATRRHGATATLLADGRVLVAGGFDGGDGGGVGGDPGVGGLASAEIYDPQSGTFSATGSMTTQRERASAVLLADGRVLIIGGYGAFSGALLNTSEIYDPATGQFGSVATMPGGGRQNMVATLLTSGRVLVAGGATGGSTHTASALVYNPASNTYAATGSMAIARGRADAVLLPSGKVLVIGGQSAQFAATPLIESYDPATGMFAVEGNLATARLWASVSMLPSGRILVAGGYVPPPNSSQGLTIVGSAELIEQPVTSSVALAQSMTTPRAAATSSILLDGRVLLAGGRNGNTVLASAEVYSDVLDTFTAVGPLSEARERASAALLADGSVVVIGGRNAAGTTLASAERFNPQAQAFTANPRPLWQARHSAGSALLANGHLLVVGGRNAGGPLASAETYDGHTGMFRMTRPLATARSESSTVLLADGSVLVAAGEGASGVLASAERYDAATRSFSPTLGNLATARRAAMTALLPNGKVLIAGGRDASSKALASAELYDRATDTFSAAGTLTSARADGAILVLPSGAVMLVGGTGAAGTPLASTEIYDPARGTFTPGPTLAVARTQASVALTSFGRALVVGGVGSSGTLSSAEAHLRSAFATTFTGNRPTFGVTPSALALPAALVLDGEGLRGSRRFPNDSIAGSEGSSGGTSNTASNVPLLRLQRIDNQQVIYQAPDPDLPWTDLEFNTPILTRFDPFDVSSRMAGAYRVVVGVNGVESSAQYASLYWIEDAIFASGIENGE